MSRNKNRIKIIELDDKIKLEYLAKTVADEAYKLWLEIWKYNVLFSDTIPAEKKKQDD